MSCVANSTGEIGSLSAGTASASLASADAGWWTVPPRQKPEPLVVHPVASPQRRGCLRCRQLAAYQGLRVALAEVDGLPGKDPHETRKQAFLLQVPAHTVLLSVLKTVDNIEQLVI